MRLALYLRVSTTSQLDGYGLDVQEADARAWAKRHKHTIVTVCRDEGLSGARDAVDREGLSCALGAVEAGEADGVLCSSLSRLARALHVQEAVLASCWQLGGRVFTLETGEVLQDDPDDPMRRAMRQMAGVFFELERAVIRKRLRDGRAMKRASGGYIGGTAPYGYAVTEEGTLEPVGEEQAVIARASALRADGLSLRAVASALDTDGIRPRSGGRWHPTTVVRMLDSTRPQPPL